MGGGGGLIITVKKIEDGRVFDCLKKDKSRLLGFNIFVLSLLVVAAQSGNYLFLFAISF